MDLQKKRKRDRLYYQKRRQYYVDKAAKWAAENPEKVSENHRKYDRRNQKVKNARTAKYKATKIEATPKWLTEIQIAEIVNIYKNCPTGYHVDHIIPLRGKGVRGLHVPWNLQYLPVIENLRKSNKP